MKKITIIITLISIAFFAEAQIEIDGLIRPRAEFRSGYKSPRTDNSEPAFFIGQRTRLNFQYANEKVKTRLSFFDARVWGDQVWKSDVSSTGIHEAWAEIKISEAFAAKFGRQELKYDNSRLISPVNWNNVGAAHDLLLIKYRKNDWILDLGTGWNQSKEQTSGTNYNWSKSYYKNLNFLWLSKKFGNISTSTLNISDGNQNDSIVEKINYRITSGLILDYKKDRLQATLRGFGQFGELSSNQEVSAWFANVDLSYKATEKLKLTLGCEMMSGNDATDTIDATDHAFDILLGGRHKFNGHMDYFNTPASTKRAGLIDSYLKVDFKLSEKASLLGEYHYFMLENNYLNNGQVIDQSLGNELDFVFQYKLLSDVAIEAGYSMFLGTQSTEIIKGGNMNLMNNWVYLMVSVSPKFFKSEKK